MNELWDLVKNHFGTIIGAIVIGAMLIIGMVRGSIGSVNFTKGEIVFKGRKAKVLRLSTLNKILDNQILKLDGEMVDFAITQSDKFRRDLLQLFSKYLKHPSAKRVIAGSIRIPLYNAARRNRFHEALRPSKTKEYLDNLIDEIKLEYADINIEQTDFQCPVHGGNCIEYPAWEAFKDDLRQMLTKQWAFPTREYRIKISQKKIALYEQYIVAYDELGDETRVLITQQCIDKNNKYIEALKEKVNE